MKRIVLFIVQLNRKEIYNFILVSFNSIHVSIFQFCFVKLEVRIDMSFISFILKKKKRRCYIYILEAHAQRLQETVSMWDMVIYMYNDS